MKTPSFIKKAIIFSSLTGLLISGSCQKEHCHPQETPPAETQQTASLVQSYNLTKTYNDSLEMCYNGTLENNPQTINYYEMHYHYHDSLMTQMHELCHDQMMEGHTSGMMGNNNGGMMNGNMCNCIGENTDSHAMIDSLRQNHSQYHPL